MDKLGILLINKPVGITSFDIIRRLRRITNIKQIGHAGTLDPFAEGLMQILVGKATKIAQYLTNYDKSYQVQLQFGIKTDTGDSTGQVIVEENLDYFPIDEDFLKAKVENLREQIPPIYSAIKVDGQRAYKLARKKQDFVMNPRPISISDFIIIDYSFPILTYKCKVSKGTYIRSLSEQIAEMYGTIATTIKLDRLSVSDSHIADAINLDDITSDNWEQFLLPIERFIDCPVIQLNEKQNSDYWFGREIQVPDQADADLVIVKFKDETKGIARVDKSVLQAKKGIQIMADIVLTVGNFDGVHLGHCKLLTRLIQVAKDYDCQPLIVTYQTHPKISLGGKLDPYLLTTTSQKISLLHKCGIDHIELVNFTKEFANMSPYAFLKNELIDKFHPKAIVLGYDTKFGKNRQGDYDFIKNHEFLFKYKTFQVDPLIIEGNIVSSSIIRKLIKQGQLFKAGEYLGRRFSFWGKVIEGKRLGRTLGYPTINIQALTAAQLTPPDGVYLSQTLTRQGVFYSITNIGKNPTVSNSLDQKIESYILDFDKDIYGEEVETSFVRKLRDEMKYSSIDDLKHAIAADVVNSRRMIDELKDTF